MYLMGYLFVRRFLLCLTGFHHISHPVVREICFQRSFYLYLFIFTDLCYVFRSKSLFRFLYHKQHSRVLSF